jgi:uncharacterized protein with HEPN domain
MARSLVPRLIDMVEAIQRVREAVEDVILEEFEADWRRQWLVERGSRSSPWQPATSLTS